MKDYAKMKIPTSKTTNEWCIFWLNPHKNLTKSKYFIDFMTILCYIKALIFKCSFSTIYKSHIKNLVSCQIEDIYLKETLLGQ